MQVVDPKTTQDAIGWIKRSLGSGIVVVELRDEHFHDSLNDAIRWYVGRKGIARRAVVQVQSTRQEYEMPDDCDEVLEVWPLGAQLDIIAAVNPFAFIDVDQLPVAYQSLTGVPGGSFYGTLHQILAHAETARRVIGAEIAWEFFKDTNILHLTPFNQRSGVAVARYLSSRLVMDYPVAPATFPVNDFARLRTRHRDMILRFAVSCAKERLGRIRGKYTEFPSAGGAKTMDGETLLAEARDEKTALSEELLDLSEGVPFLIG